MCHSKLKYPFDTWTGYGLPLKKVYEDTTLADDYVMTGTVTIYELTPEQVEEMFLTPREDEEETE